MPEPIHDPRFLRQVARLVCWRPSRFLDGCSIVIRHSDTALEIHISNGMYSMLAFEWHSNHAAVLMPPTARDLVSDDVDDELLTLLVGRFLRRHGLLTRSTRKGKATA